jgi:hypothetical protein
VQALIADRLRTSEDVSTPLNRDKIVRRCGLGDAKRAGWLFEYLKQIGFLQVQRNTAEFGRGREVDTFIVFTQPPSHYIGPCTHAELELALDHSDRESGIALFENISAGHAQGARLRTLTRDQGAESRSLVDKTAGQPKGNRSRTFGVDQGDGSRTLVSESAGQPEGAQSGTFLQIDRRSSISEGEIEDRSSERVPREEDTAPAGAVVDVPGVRDLVQRLPWREWATKRKVPFRWTKADAAVVTAAISHAVSGAEISLAQAGEIAVAALRKADSNPVGYVASAFGEKHLATWVERIEEGPPLASDPLPLEPAGRRAAPAATAHQETPSSAGPVTSPVTWLTDAQFAALSPQDRAHVRAVGDTPIDQLKPLAARRVAAVKRSVQDAAGETADTALQSEPDLVERRIS